jgi:hypothetical protein
MLQTGVLALTIAGWFAPPPAEGREVLLRTGSSARAALRRVQAGDTVRVGPGTFEIETEIPGGVVMIGAGMGRTVITRPQGQALTLRGDNTLAHLTVREAESGVVIEGGSTLVTDCEIEDCRFFGIRVNEGLKAELRRCTLADNGTGILAGPGSAPLIVDCRLRGNQTGIRSEDAAAVIFGSEITANDVGITVTGRSVPVVGDHPVRANRIHRNRRANLINEGGTAIPARYNYWGGTDCSFVRGFEGPIRYRPTMNLALSDSLSACP